MPPAKKKQKTAVGDAKVLTLSDFFQSGGASGSSKTPSKKPPKGIAKGGSKAGGSFVKSSRVSDIIVISDDDDDRPPSSGSNPRHTNALPTPPISTSTSKSDSTPKKNSPRASAVPPDVSLQDSVRSRPRTPQQSMFAMDIDVAAEESGPFGLPVLLMDSSPSPAVNCGPNEDPSRGCTPPPPAAVQGIHCTVADDTFTSFDASIPTKIPSEIIDVDALDAETDWLNMDDEFVDEDGDETLDESGDIEDSDDTLPSGKGKGKCLGEIVLDDAESEEACPVCGLAMVDWGEERISKHVNICIDAPRPKSSTPKPGSSRPTAPLSSFQKFHSPAPNAFSLLMSGRKESEAWKAAEVDLAKGDSAVGKARRAEGRRKAPFYKVMQGMPIAVDAFRYGKIPGVKVYFLTHAHSDHYTNLSSSWKNGPIYCSHTTANLIKLMLKVDEKWLRPLPFDTPTILPETGGVEVTLLEANHCPGSCLFLFKGPQTINAGDSDFKSPFVGSRKTFRYLHCGDFRASPRHAVHPCVKDQKLDLVYLDTTYLNAKYCFPPQKQVIDACAELAKKLVFDTSSSSERTQPSVGKWFAATGSSGHVKAGPCDDNVKPGIDPPEDLPTDLCADDEQKPDLRLIKDEEDLKAEVAKIQKGKALVVIGTYSIGKERIVKAVAKALSSQVYCDSRKRAILLCQDDPDLHALLTNDPYAAQVHLVPLQTITMDKIEPYYTKYRSGFTSVIGFRPTGWTYSAPAGTDLIPAIPSLIARTQARNFTSSSLSLGRNSSSTYKLYGVPYSEHSSFFELTCFALSVDVVKFIATVNVGSAKSRGMMAKWFEKWDGERKKRIKEGKEKIVPARDPDYW